MEKVPMTNEGYRKLEAELHRLKAEERPRIIQQISDARAHGDLSENAEYHAAKDAQGLNEARVADLEDKIARAEIIDPSKLPGVKPETEKNVNEAIQSKLMDKGQIVGRQDYGAGSTYVGGVIDIEALRDHRARAQWDNWMKDLRTELYQILYEQPIYPKNLYLDRVPMKHAEYKEQVITKQIELMHARGIWKKPER